MLRRRIHILSVVLFLFLGAMMLKSFSTLVISQMGSTHHGGVMACSIDGDCSSSCSLDGKKICSCNHAASADDASNTKVCGCDHDGNTPLGTNVPFQIKAPLVSVFDGITFSPTTIFLSLKQHHLFMFTDDIFHPPRLRA